jgi:hypothetical protein
MNLEDLVYCAAALVTIASFGTFLADHFNVENDSRIAWMKKYVESDAMPILRRRLTRTREEYRSLPSDTSDESKIFCKYAHFPIHDTPIIEIEGKQIVPFPDLIRHRVFSLLHKDFLDYFRENERENEKVRNFPSQYGGVFKEYVGILLRACFGDVSSREVGGERTFLFWTEQTP